ncbi:MAG: DUF1593 domain-containing protein [Ferruginibacter sp.]|nr:DUF1593 domain-containing protein [Ferruginibacter sp.]
MQKRLLFSTLLMILVVWAHPALSQSPSPRVRTIVTTDGEVDDQDSFIRLLLYANEFSIEGLIYSSSQWHYKGDGKGTMFTSEMKNTKERYGSLAALRWPGTTWIQEFIDKYASVYPTLLQHDKKYPSPESLKQVTRVGNIDFEGAMFADTEGSDFIKQKLLDSTTAPIYLQIWGGTNTVARALKSIEEEYNTKNNWSAIREKVSRKAILYMVLDQDATYQKYISVAWPAIRVMYNSDQFWCLAYPWTRFVPAELQRTLRGPWFSENIKFNHGPLLASYYLWGDGTAIENDPEHTHGDIREAKKFGLGQYDFISEGDSPAFFYLVDVGLRNMEDASYGGWGGRMVQAAANPNRWEDGKHVTDYNPFTKKLDAAYPQTRWITALQNDFAARADWCVNGYEKANHAPVVKLVGANNIAASVGTRVKLKSTVKDPDGDNLHYKWWQYEEVDSYAGKIQLTGMNQAAASFKVPKDAKKGDTIHVILEVSDSGTPSLTRYQRVVVSVR